MTPPLLKRVQRHSLPRLSKHPSGEGARLINVTGERGCRCFFLPRRICEELTKSPRTVSDDEEHR